MPEFEIPVRDHGAEGGGFAPNPNDPAPDVARGLRNLKFNLETTASNGGQFIISNVGRAGMVGRVEVLGPSQDYIVRVLRGRGDSAMQYGYHHQGSAAMVDDGPPWQFTGDDLHMVIKIEPQDGIHGNFNVKIQFLRGE